MRLLLDTNAYSRMRDGDQAVLDVVRRCDEVVFSTVVAGELLGGFRAGTRLERNLEELRSFLEEPRVTLVPVTWTTADRYSRIYASLKRKGRPIPINDMWIAAHAMETGADLLSFDPHFRHVEGLAWVHPGSPA